MKRRFDSAFAELSSAYGGIENFHEEQKKINHEAQQAWQSDTISLGRVLRAHLYLEYYINKYLQEKLRTPKRTLKNYAFNKKIQKLKPYEEFSHLIPSIEKINRIRNNMAHNLKATLREKDINDLKKIKDLTPHRIFLKDLESDDHAQIYELYCHYIASQISDSINPKKHLIDAVFKAISQDLVDVYRGRLEPRFP